MRNIFLAVFLFGATAGFAQPKGYKDVPSLPAFQQSLAKNTATIQSLQSDFTQTKVLSLLSDKVSSKGKFTFRKEDKVRIEYTSPYQYLLVMNGGQVMVKDEQKTSKLNTKNSKTMQSVNRIMMDCMRGTVFANPDFKTTAFESAGGYLLSMKPANPAMQKMFQQIDIYLDKRYDVNKLVMTEQGGDYTEMMFKNVQHNPAISDALFSVR